MNKPALKRGFHWNESTQSLGIYVNGVCMQDYPETLGRTYYVNNITGSSTNDGLSWGSPMDQLSTAITASETYRQLGAGAPTVETNDYVRNTIVVQGTGTTYTYISALPSYCNVIGLGATPFGDGTGIVVIGDATGTADGIAGTSRGLYLYNVQCVGAGSFYGADFAVLYRSTIEDCAFGGNASSAAAAVALNLVSGSGVVIRRCRTVGHAATPVIGFQFASAGGNFNECLVEDCAMMASGTGFSAAGYLQNNTWIRNNVAYGGTTGISDTSAESTMYGNSFYTNNFGSGGSTGMTVSQNAAYRAVLNVSCSAGTASIYSAYG
jgi:hypothetical protein